MSYTILSKYYDRLMTDVDYDSWCNFIIDKSNIQNRSLVVDAACGTGSIGVRLAKKGASVIGIDCSEDMLAMASQNARKHGVNIALSQMDITKMKFHRPVDAICCVCDGVNYITQSSITSFVKSSYDALVSGGMLIFDISSEYKLINILGDNLFYEDHDDVTYLWQNCLTDNYVNMELSFFVKQPNGSYLRYDEEHTQYIHKSTSLLKSLEVCGFKNIKMYDCYTLNSIKPNTERITFVAIK